MTNAIKPDHYQNGKIDVIESLWLSMSEEQFRGFMTGNVIKYVMRYPRKGGIEDLEKAREYIDRLIENENRAMNIRNTCLKGMIRSLTIEFTSSLMVGELV